MRHYSGSFLSFLAYYMGAPSDQFLHLLWRPPYVFFFHTIWGPLGSVLCILYWGPQITFFAYYMGPLRLVSSHTIWGPSQISFIVYYMPPPPPHQISFFACYRVATTDFSFFYKVYGGPLRSVSPLTIWGPSG